MVVGMIKVRLALQRIKLFNGTAKIRSASRIYQSRRNFCNDAGSVILPTTNIFSAENITFGNMTRLEMMRSILVLWICSIPGFSNNASRVLDVGKICLGRRLFSKLLRATAYGQFVAGDQIDEIHASAERLACNNVAQMLAVPIEAPDENDPTTRCEQWEVNLTKAIDCIRISRATQFQGRECLMQLKLTAIMDFDNLEYMSTKLNLDGLCNYDTMQNWIKTGCIADDLVSISPKLNKSEAELFSDGVKRFVKVIAQAEEQGVSVLIDAEHTWINPIIQHLGVTFMGIYNRLRPVVYMTYQAYLKETRGLIRAHEKECLRNNVYFALKLVRGAYVVIETKRHGSHPPYMCDDWEATNKNYDECLTDLLLMDSKYSRVVVATHNENSIRRAVELLRERSQPVGVESNVSFAQLYGMADYMSFTLGSMGYQVYKSVPYGTVDETLCYLSRRVKENCLVLSGVRKEMKMLRKGLRRRILTSD